MAEKRYIVLEGQRYKGKHKVYTEGQDFPESELFGNEDNVLMAIHGAKDKKNDKGVLLIKGKAPRIKLVTTKAAKK
jgi:hypothetical protein